MSGLSGVGITDRWARPGDIGRAHDRVLDNAVDLISGPQSYLFFVARLTMHCNHVVSAERYNHVNCWHNYMALFTRTILPKHECLALNKRLTRRNCNKKWEIRSTQHAGRI
jgi:hypothetical protein